MPCIFVQLYLILDEKSICWTKNRSPQKRTTGIPVICLSRPLTLWLKRRLTREFGAFAKLDNSCQKIVITNDDIDFSTSTVRHIQFGDFVQMDEL